MYRIPQTVSIMKQEKVGFYKVAAVDKSTCGDGGLKSRERLH